MSNKPKKFNEVTVLSWKKTGEPNETRVERHVVITEREAEILNVQKIKGKNTMYLPIEVVEAKVKKEKAE